MRSDARRSSATFTMPVVALLPLVIAACSAESPVSTGSVSSPVTQQAQRANANIFPASTYRLLQLFPGTPSGARDINGAMQVVGWIKRDAFLHDLRSGATYSLPRGAADTAAANAVNHFGAAGGYLARAARYPAVWPTPSNIVQLKEVGEVNDLNDRNEAVEWLRNARGVQQGLFWDVNRRVTALLPLPRGATWARANGINNDRVIVGESDVGGVMWTGAPGSFRVRILHGIRPLAVDGGYGTVGDDGNPVLPNAIYGSPDSTGFFGYGASAKRVNGWGVAVGQAYAFFTPYEAFVADRFGNVTLLPVAAVGFAPAGATGINDCGAVSGYVALTNAPEAVVWDPGC